MAFNAFQQQGSYGAPWQQNVQGIFGNMTVVDKVPSDVSLQSSNDKSFDSQNESLLQF